MLDGYGLLLYIIYTFIYVSHVFMFFSSFLTDPALKAWYKLVPNEREERERESDGRRIATKKEAWMYGYQVQFIIVLKSWKREKNIWTCTIQRLRIERS